VKCKVITTIKGVGWICGAGRICGADLYEGENAGSICNK